MSTGSPGRRTLVVVRHAQAEASGPTDFERRLAPQGQADAEAVGSWLADRDIVPDHALVSAAVRTTESWQSIARAAGWELEPELDHGMYAADPATVLDLVRAVADDVRTLVLLGHSPTMPSLVQLLDDGEGDVEAGNQLIMGYPTAATTILAYNGAWAELTEASASVVAFFVGRG